MKSTTNSAFWLLDDVHELAKSIRWCRANGLKDSSILEAVLALLDDAPPQYCQPRSAPEPPLLPGMPPERERSDP